MGERLPIHEIAERWSRMSKEERKASSDRIWRVFFIACWTLLAITVVVPPLFGNNDLIDAIRAFFASNQP